MVNVKFNWDEAENFQEEEFNWDEAENFQEEEFNWDEVIFENFQEEKIIISNDELEVNENFKNYNGKKVIFRNCSNLKRIEANCLNLASLEIENCPNLEYLSAYHNEIRKLDFTGCKKLKTIYVPYNNRLDKNGKREFALETIDIKDCQELEDLNVSSCNLSQLDLTNNIKLKTLSCDNTLIRKLNIKHLSELEFLHCFRCRLKELDCGGLKNLKELNCAQNNLFLEKLNVKGCDDLEELDCAENSLKKLDLSDLKNLNFVSVKENLLKQLNIAGCPKLNFLDFSNQFNAPKSVYTFFKVNIDNKNLKKLFCDELAVFFDLDTKKVYNDNGWKHFDKLELLEIGKRKGVVYCVMEVPEFDEYLTNKKKKEQQEDEGYQSGETQTNNHIPKKRKKSEYENQAWLSTWLELKALKDKVFINNLDNYKHELKDLDLSWQNLTGKLVIGNWTNLKSLNVSNNELEHLVVKDCPNLERIIFSHNQLKKVEISGCPKLNYEYSYNSDNFVNPVEENLEDEKAQNLLAQEKITLDKLLTLDFNKLSEVVRYQVIKLAENLILPLTYEELVEINTDNIPRELAIIMIKLLTKKFKERLDKERKKKDLQKIAGLIVKAQKALKKKDLKQLKAILAEIEKYCNTDSYTKNKEIISNLEQGLKQELLKTQQQLISNNNKPINYPLIIGVSVVSVGFLVILAKFLQNKIKKIVKFK